MPLCEDHVEASPLLAGLFPAGIVAMETRQPGDPALLSAAERVQIARARPKRAGEFTAGRLCARRALAAFGREGWDLLAGPDRAPRWPPDMVGSISHVEGYCGAVLAARSRFRSLGLDVELDSRVTAELHEQVLTAAERRCLATAEPGHLNRWATLGFAAKEAFYKCQYPLTGEWLDFIDIEIDFAPLVRDPAEACGRLAVRPCRPLDVERHWPAPWQGRFALGGERVYVGFAVSGATGCQM